MEDVRRGGYRPRHVAGALEAAAQLEGVAWGAGGCKGCVFVVLSGAKCYTEKRERVCVLVRVPVASLSGTMPEPETERV